MGRLAAKKRKKIYGYLKDEKPRSSTYTECVLSLIFPFSVSSYSLFLSVFSLQREAKAKVFSPSDKHGEAKVLSLILVIDLMWYMTGYLFLPGIVRRGLLSSSNSFFGLGRRGQIKSHQGNGWKKPFAGSFHLKDFIVHDEM